MRLVPHQDSNEITQLFTEHFQQIAPKHVKVKVTPHHGGEASVIPTNSIGYKAASRAMEKTWGKEPIPTREGGSIPIVALFQKELGLDSILMGFGLQEDAIHSPNESYGLFNYYRGIETISYFYQYFAEMSWFVKSIELGLFLQATMPATASWSNKPRKLSRTSNSSREWTLHFQKLENQFGYRSHG